MRILFPAPAATPDLKVKPNKVKTRFTGINDAGFLFIQLQLAEVENGIQYRLHEQNRAAFLRMGSVVPIPQTVLSAPPTPNTATYNFGSALYPHVDGSVPSLDWVSRSARLIFRYMPPLLPREIS